MISSWVNFPDEILGRVASMANTIVMRHVPTSMSVGISRLGNSSSFLNSTVMTTDSMMEDADYLYGSLIKDIYFNGRVLARKYRLLRLSYSFFMFGFVASIIGFTIALLLYYYPTGN